MSETRDLVTYFIPFKCWHACGYYARWRVSCVREKRVSRTKEKKNGKCCCYASMKKGTLRMDDVKCQRGGRELRFFFHALSLSLFHVHEERIMRQWITENRLCKRGVRLERATPSLARIVSLSLLFHYMRVPVHVTFNLIQLFKRIKVNNSMNIVNKVQ